MKINRRMGWKWSRTTADDEELTAVSDGKQPTRTLWMSTMAAGRMVVVEVEGGFERLGECYGREKRR